MNIGAEMENIILSNGISMPRIGLGTYNYSSFDECCNSVSSAIKTGYRLIDTATFYKNQDAVGAGIKKSRIARRKLFVISKVWIDEYSTSKCTKSIESSLEKLGLDYLDMVLLHWPYKDVYSAWRVMEKYYKVGKIRSLGISNFTPDRMIDFMNSVSVKPVVNQIEMNLFCQRVSDRKWMDKYGVAVQAYSPLGHGQGQEMMDHSVVEFLSRKYHKTPAQIILRYLVQCGVSIIPKSAHQNRITENFDIFDFSLTPGEESDMQNLDRNQPSIGIPQDPKNVEAMLKWY